MVNQHSSQHRPDEEKELLKIKMNDLKALVRGIENLYWQRFAWDVEEEEKRKPQQQQQQQQQQHQQQQTMYQQQQQQQQQQQERIDLEKLAQAEKQAMEIQEMLAGRGESSKEVKHLPLIVSYLRSVRSRFSR